MIRNKIDKTCVECKAKNKTQKDRAREIYLCQECFNSEKYALICKTDVKTKYLLTDSEIKDCEYYTVSNGWYQDKKLYHLREIKDIFCSKNKISRDDDDVINNKMISLKEEKERRKVERKTIATMRRTERERKAKERHKKLSEIRRVELREALAEYGLELRDDSNLCDNYIDGEIKEGDGEDDWSLDQIVHRMCQMKYLYDYCNMSHCCDKAYRRQEEEKREGFWPDCSVFEEGEMIALEKYGENGGYPKVWPWLKK
jgi:hypothetical protein